MKWTNSFKDKPPNSLRKKYRNRIRLLSVKGIEFVVNLPTMKTPVLDGFTGEFL